MTKNNFEIEIFSTLFVQTIMLFLFYGLHYDMPFWVVWFPFIFTAFIILIVVIIVIISLIFVWMFK